MEDLGLNTLGHHLLAEYYMCDTALLDDAGQLERCMRMAAQAAGATVVQAMFHRFSPQGISGVLVIKESHLSIHTWPEHGYAAVDFYTCGTCNPMLAHEALVQALKAQQHEIMLIERGGWCGDMAFKMQQHACQQLSLHEAHEGMKS